MKTKNKQPRATWNYRIMKHRDKIPKRLHSLRKFSTWWTLHEVHYSNGKINGHALEPARVITDDCRNDKFARLGIIRVLEMMLADAKRHRKVLRFK